MFWIEKNSIHMFKNDVDCALSLHLGGQMTKPIIVVKMPCNLLYIVQVKGLIKRFKSRYQSFWLLITIFALFYSQAVFDGLLGIVAQMSVIKFAMAGIQEWVQEITIFVVFL